MPLRDRPLLVDGIDRDFYVPRPQLESALWQSLVAGRNVLLIGPPGSGKSTALRKLSADIYANESIGALVLASTATSTEELLTLVRSELGFERTSEDVARTDLIHGRIHEAPIINLIDAVRKLGRAQKAVIMVDGPLSAEIVYELFGRLREELWTLTHQWVLALRTDQSAAARKPPADAFFPAVVEIPPLQAAEAVDLLERALTKDELQTVRTQLTDHGELFPTGSPSGTHYPRDVVNLAHRALAGTLVAPDAALRRAKLAADLGPSASLALAEIEALGRPVSAGDSDFLKRMGWTEAHARRLLAQMERGGVLRSIKDMTAASPGRPRKLYAPNQEE